VLQGILGTCLFLIAAVFFRYKNAGWPFDQQGAWCAGAFIVVAITGLVSALAARTGSGARGALGVGFALGVLWTAEITMNNVLHPALPLRDYLDDAFWAMVAVGLVAGAAIAARRSRHVAAASVWGCWAGLASGSVACLTGLLFIVFGMPFITGDPVDKQEWAAQGSTSGYSTISVYWAHQSLVGALLHLVILGPLFGAVLGALAGAATLSRAYRSTG
jgi:hypothetical protein